MLDELNRVTKKYKKILELLPGASNKGFAIHKVFILSLDQCMKFLVIRSQLQLEVLWSFPLDANSKSRLVNLNVCATDLSLYQIVVISEVKKQNDGVCN